jgi:hypothetical protein
MKLFAECRGAVVSIVVLAFCPYSARIVAQTLARGASQQPTNSTAVRVLNDPTLIVSCWLLERDSTHPEGPGRWLQAPSRELGDSIPLNRPITGVARGVVTDHTLPVIHGGDTLMIEEDSKLAEVRLQAVALKSAGPGEIFAVRLRSTGKMILAVAVAPGRAEFAQGTGARP